MELRNTNIITPVGLFVSCISSSQQFIIKAQNYARRDWDHLDAYFIFEPIRCLVIFNVFVSVNLMSLSHGMSRIGIPTVVPCRAMSCHVVPDMLGPAHWWWLWLSERLLRSSRARRALLAAVSRNVNGESEPPFWRHPLPLYRVCYVDHRLIVCVSWCVTLNEMLIEYFFPLPEQLQAAKVEKCQWSPRPPLSHPGWSSQFTLLPSGKWSRNWKRKAEIKGR